MVRQKSNVTFSEYLVAFQGVNDIKERQKLKTPSHEFIRKVFMAILENEKETGEGIYKGTLITKVNSTNNKVSSALYELLQNGEIYENKDDYFKLV